MTIDSNISTAHVDRAWLGTAPSTFFVRWTGFVAIGTAGTYTFTTSSDDGSTLSIDGRVVVDNGGQHSEISRSGEIALEAGPHLVVLEYFQNGGPYAMSWSWERDGGRPEPIPGWVLAANRIPYWKAVAARALDALRMATAAAALLLVSSLLVGYRARISEVPKAACLALFIVFAALQTWPLVTSPGRLSRNDNSDTMLNEWTLAWVVHQAPRGPLHLYDANIFFPARDTLAYSEALVVQSTFAAPILWLGGSPVLAYNLVLLAGFALTGWAMSLVVARWTGDWSAGVLAGIVVAFNAHSLTRLPHIQAQHLEFLPLALLALDGLLHHPRLRHAVWLAVWFTLQALTSIYMLALSTAALGAGAIARPEDWWGRRRFTRFAPWIVLSAALATALLFPFLLPYWRLRYETGLSRSLEDATRLAATWQDYVSTPGRFHFQTWSRQFFHGNALFPGALALILAGYAMVTGVAFRDRRARMALAFGAAGLVLSFGAAVPGYATLYRILPLLQGIRAVHRFGHLAIVAVAILAGFGIAHARRVVPRRIAAPMSALCIAIAFVEPLAAPLELVRFDGIPPIYDRLRAETNAVVVEVPFYEPRIAFANARYMLASTRHWRPLLNGYSGFQPASYYERFERFRRFPDAESIAAMQAEGVTHIVVHADELDPSTVPLLDRKPALRKIAVEGPIAIYELTRVRVLP